MRRTILWALALLAPSIGQSVFGQAPTVLNQLEQRLQGSGQAGSPASGAATPGSGYLGAVVDDDGEQGRGVRVISAKAGAPAAISGLKDGDLIVAIDGKQITGLSQLDAILDRAVPNQKLQMTIDRGGRQQPLTVTLGNRPPPTPGDQNAAEASPAAPSLQPPATSPATLPPASSPPISSPPGPGSFGSPSLTPPTGASSPIAPAPSGAGDSGARGSGIQATPLNLGSPPGEAPPNPGFGSAPPVAGGGGASLGITVVPLTDQIGNRAPVRRGAVIAAIKPGSPADTAGLPMGGLIVRIDGRPVDSADDLVAAIRAARPGQEVELTYYDGDRLVRKSVRLAPAGATAAPGAPSGGGFGGGPRTSGGFGGGFGTAPAPGAVAQSDQPRPAPATGGTRPLLQRIERMADNLSRPAGTSTVYDPLVMAALQTRVVEMGEHIKALEDRIKALESKLGGGAAPAPSASGAPGPSAGPSFGSPTGGTGTTP